MAELIVMDRTGDSRTAFTADDSASVDAAMTRFAEMVGKGYTAVGEVNGQKAVIRAFDPDAEKIILYPQYIGG